MRKVAEKFNEICRKRSGHDLRKVYFKESTKKNQPQILESDTMTISKRASEPLRITFMTIHKLDGKRNVSKKIKPVLWLSEHQRTEELYESNKHFVVLVGKIKSQFTDCFIV